MRRLGPESRVQRDDCHLDPSPLQPLQQDASSKAHGATAIFTVDQDAHERLGSVHRLLLISNPIRYSTLLNELRTVAQAGFAVPLVLIYARASVILCWLGWRHKIGESI